MPNFKNVPDGHGRSLYSPSDVFPNPAATKACFMPRPAVEYDNLERLMSSDSSSPRPLHTNRNKRKQIIEYLAQIAEAENCSIIYSETN